MNGRKGIAETPKGVLQRLPTATDEAGTSSERRLLMAKIWKEDAVRVTATYKDFNGDLLTWKNAFYELWRYQLTYSMAYKLAVRESNKSGVFVDILVRPAYKDNLVETMRDLGYRNMTVYDEKVGIVECTDTDVYTIVVE